jgi:protein subunit release factor A
MTNLHLVVIQAFSAPDACNAVEIETANEDSEITVLGCISEDNEIYIEEKSAGDVLKEYNNITAINELVSSWIKDYPYDKKKVKELIKQASDKVLSKNINPDEWSILKKYCEFKEELSKIKNPRKFNVLKDVLFDYQYTESGVTNFIYYYGEDDDKKYVVFIEVHR